LIDGEIEFLRGENDRYWSNQATLLEKP